MFVSAPEMIMKVVKGRTYTAPVKSFAANSLLPSALSASAMFRVSSCS